MRLGNNRTPAGTRRPRPRFRIDRLEERIAPKGWGKGGKGSNNTCFATCANGCSFDGCGGSSY